MFASFLLPFRAKHLEASYLWVLYKQINHFTPDEIIFVGSEEYFQDPQVFIDENRWDISPPSQEYSEFDLPSREELAEYRKLIIPSTLFADLEESGVANEEIVRRLLSCRLPILETALEEAFSDLVRRDKPAAILSWCNVPSLTAVANTFGIPVIHNELGPLRKPCYYDAAYFDFQGVNGNTEAKDRFDRFRAEGGETKVPILTRRELLDLFLMEPSRASTGEPIYEIGLPLQVENDSNIIAFSNGWNNQRLIEALITQFGRKQSLIRRHPGGLRDYPETSGMLDRSADSIEFLGKCRRIVTINSSVGLEAMLFGRETVILGDSPFALAAANQLDPAAGSPESEEQLLMLNFLLFGYLIPYEFLYDQAYFRWRLTHPSEVEIYQFNFTYQRRRQLLLKQCFRFQSEGLACEDNGLLKFCLRNRYELRRQARRISELEQEINSWRLITPFRILGRLVSRWRG